MNLTEQALVEAHHVLKLCSTKHGFFAAYPGYDMVFGRDSCIISIGASLLKDDLMKNTFKQSLVTLAKSQSQKGQIPNAVDKFVKSRKHHVDFKSIDSTLWFLIANKVYAKRYRDKSLLRKYKDNIQRALTWLSYQDMGEDSMLEQQPTSDWQDAFPHKYGHTINTQALYYHVLRLYGNNSEAKRLWNAVNKNKDDGLWNDKKGFYFPYRWKNHNKYKEIGDWFDSLGNLLAIVYELADKKQSNKILDYIKRKKINKPFPVRAIDPPIDKKHKDWKDYYLDSDAGIPYHYLNAGIWTFIGGIYVCALVKMKRFSEAEKELQKLAEANLKKPFYSEWLHGKTGKPGVSGDSSDEGNQGWNAAMYVVAFESVRRGKALA